MTQDSRSDAQPRRRRERNDADKKGNGKAAEKSKRERFVEVAGRRGNNALRQLENLGRCANRALYEYDDADVARLVSTLQAALEDLQRRFAKPEQRELRFE